MRFVCESCRAQYMINDEKVGPKGVKVRCRKCGYVILVKRPEAAKGGGPVAMSNDPDDALATQVMQTPLAAAEATLSTDEGPGNEDLTNPGTVPATAAPESKVDTSNFFGADEDEIGAVFDQVLKSGSHPVPRDAAAQNFGDDDDDRQSTRVLDADTVRKLAKESGPAAAQDPEPKAEEVPQTDWYVAINDKQTGPLTIENIKSHWDAGEISPDSLCWRAGFDDWLPVSEVKMLSSVLAPKPPKPIVVAPAATITQSAPVVSVPVQSAFSAGGVMQTVQAEVQVPMAAAAAPEAEESSWKPSAASALASLVKDEMDALARPPPPAPAPSAPEPVSAGGGLLDLPVEDEKKPAGATVVPPPARPAPPPANPYLANPGATYSAPAVTQYRPPSNRGLIIAMAGGAIAILLVLIGLIVWLGTRQPTQVVVQQPVQAPPVQVAQAQLPPPQPAPTQPVAAQPTTPAPTQPVAAQPTTPEATAPAANPGTPPAAAQPTTPTPAPSAPTPPAPATPKTSGSSRSTPRNAVAAKEKDEPAPAPAPSRAEPKKSGGGDDDFESAFGVSKKSEPAAKEEPKKAPKDVYVPPAPGGAGGAKETLEQSDIMETVLAHKAELLKCTQEQKAKEPGVSGKLVLKWTVQTSGKVTNVGVVSEEFKGTYMASCVGALVKTFVFPRHKVQHEPVQFPFKF